MNALPSLAVLLLSVTGSTFASNTANPNPTGKWAVWNGTVNCILATFDATFMISYEATNVNTNHTYTRNTTISIPASAKVNATDSFCSAGTVSQTQRMTIEWYNGTYYYAVKVSFERSNVSATTSISEMRLLYDLRDSGVFIEATPLESMLQTAVTKPDATVATINQGMFFKCDSGTPAWLSTWNQTEDFATTAFLTNAKFQAFLTSNSSQFEGNPETCSADDVVTTTFMPITTTGLPLQVANYTVMDLANRTVCLMTQFEIKSIDVTYIQNLAVPQNGTQQQTAHIAELNNGTVDQSRSHCGQNNSVMVIEGLLPGWEMWLNFSADAGRYSLHSVFMSFNLRDSSAVQNATWSAQQHSNTTGLNKWGAAVGHSYKCGAEETWKLDLSEARNISRLEVTIANVQSQAFVSNTTTSGMFGEAEVCPSNSPTSDIVPIAVGCALAALVVIVLIAYVIGRRRNRARGYESM